jgi:hypothetical protein
MGKGDLTTGAVQFKGFVGYVTITQNSTYPAPAWTSRDGNTVTFNSSDPGAVTIWTTIHELAHAWDFHSGNRLSDGLVAFTGGVVLTGDVKNWWQNGCKPGIDDWMPGCNKAGYVYSCPPPHGSDYNFDQYEDWAESVATYVHPELARPDIDKYLVKETYKKPWLYYPDYTATKRWAYVNGVIAGTLP